jgi:hypothetical protein
VLRVIVAYLRGLRLLLDVPIVKGHLGGLCVEDGGDVAEVK